MIVSLKVTQHEDARTKPPVAIACSDGCRVLVAQQAGLPVSGKRRVPGLRRSEVAALAGMSVEYYAQLERGALARVSAGVLDALARALQLDDAERVHLLRCDVELLVSGEETARRLVAMYTTPDVVD